MFGDADASFLAQLPETVKRKILQIHREGNHDVENTDQQTTPSIQNPHARSPLASQTAQAPTTATGLFSITLPQLTAGVAIVDGLLSKDSLQLALHEAQTLLASHGHAAGMGGGGGSVTAKWQSSQHRGDTAAWLKQQALQDAGHHSLLMITNSISRLSHQLSEQGYDVDGRISYQLACYPGHGARYVRHCDASPSSPNRSITAILYLNQSWHVQTDGGALVLYNGAYMGPLLGAGVTAGEPAVTIAPLGGRLVVFDSRLDHEVLPAFASRYAITAWFYRSDASVQQQPHMQHTLRAPLLLAGGANAQMTSSEQDQHSLPGQQQRATHQRPPVPEQLVEAVAQHVSCMTRL
eukprot:jgi/Chrzof1/9863/Cz04g18220.t1